jgi:hypothetical protein
MRATVSPRRTDFNSAIILQQELELGVATAHARRRSLRYVGERRDADCEPCVPALTRIVGPRPWLRGEPAEELGVAPARYESNIAPFNDRGP